MSKRITTPFPWGCYSYFFVSFWLRKYSLFADRVIMDPFLLGSYLRKKIYQSINKYIMWKSGLKRHKKAQFELTINYINLNMLHVIGNYAIQSIKLEIKLISRKQIDISKYITMFQFAISHQ